MTESNTIVQVSELEPGIVLLTLDMPGSGANILNQVLFTELDQTVELLATRTDIQGVILYSAKPAIFIAGADLMAIAATLDWSTDQIVKFCEKGRAVMARFSRCPFVTVAAIAGACVGGGLELPLWCDGRIAADDPRTRLGLPEVKLGLVPGWAGTARLPRLIGFESAAELVVTGQLVSAATAKSLGFIDEVVPRDQLLTAATAMIRRLNTSQSFVYHRRAIMGPVANLHGFDEAVARIGQKIVAQRDIFPFAPTVALEHMARTAALDQPAAWKSESLAMAQVYGSPANRGLLNHFFLIDRNKKQPGLVDLALKAQPIQRIGIVGAGLMGRSIAEHCLQRGLSVAIYDAESGLAARTASELQDNFSAQTTAATIVAAEDYQALGDVDLVIETVVETLAVKTEVLRKIEAVVSTSTLIASNTSAIPISKIATALQHPQRFCGIHFCHPELMSLVEVVAGTNSAEPTIASAVTFVRRVGKLAVAINDGAGFVVNRLLAAMLDQSIRILTSGVSVESIDEALREFGFLGGPFEIIDVIGADTCMYAGRTMWESGLRCVTVSPVIPRMVKLKRLGRKTGLGFYRYPDARGDGQADPDLPSIIDRYLDREIESGGDRSEPDAKKISDQILSAMVLEATRILEEEIVADFRDIDLCVIEGFSFPAHRGGILYWADTVGLEFVNQLLYEIAEQEPRLEPSELLKSMRYQNKKFYS